jgi:predicted LPLAT superfamily acyltransferase
LRADYEAALARSKSGVLIVGPPEIAAALAAAVPGALVFALKDTGMELSAPLEPLQERGQLHRIDVDVLEPGAWNEVYRHMMDVLGQPLRELPS